MLWQQLCNETPSFITKNIVVATPAAHWCNHKIGKEEQHRTKISRWVKLAGFEGDF